MKISLVRCLLVALSSSIVPASAQSTAPVDTPTNLQRLTGLVIADFNGDGKLDFAVTDGLGKRIDVYLNNGNSTFSTPLSTTLPISNTLGSIVAGDFNKDGKQDVIVSTVSPTGQPGQNDIFLAGKGDGTFTLPGTPLPGSFGFTNAAVVDINHDSNLDLIAGANGSLYVHLGNGDGTFTLQTFANQGPGEFFPDVVAADFNKDSKIDFVAAGFQLSTLRLFSGAGDGSFSPSTLSSTLVSPGSLASADFNGDGKPDLLVGSANIGSANVASIIFGNGDGTFQLDSPAIVTLALPPNQYTGSPNPPFVATADMNADGKPDVVIADNVTNSLCIFLNDGTGKFAQKTPDLVVSLSAGTNQLRLADLNGDGLPDMILTNALTQKVSIFFSVRTPTVTLSASSDKQFFSAPLTFTAKVTGVPANIATGTVALMDGATSLGQQTLDANGQAVFSLSTLTAGQHTLSINYSGDRNYRSTSGPSITQTVTDFQISSSSSQPIAAGALAAYTLSVTPVAGFVGSIAVTCSQLPALSSCDTLTIPVNGQPTTATLTVHTTAARSQQATAIKVAGLSLASLTLLAFLPHRRRARLGLLTMVVAFIALGLSIGCSGGGGSSAKPTVIPGTPSGTNTFTVTASATSGAQTLTHTASVSLVVQ